MGDVEAIVWRWCHITGSLRFHVWGVRIGRRYLSLAGPKSVPLFSERYRLGVRVLPLGKGWRIRLRTDSRVRQSLLSSPVTKE